MKNILIVEDNIAQAKLMNLSMKKFGYNPVVAYNVDQAKEILKNRNDFDLITLDINMPGTNGIVFLTELRDANVTTPIIMTSALCQECNIQKALEIGANEYIVKPFSLDKLKTTLDRYLK